MGHHAREHAEVNGGRVVEHDVIVMNGSDDDDKTEAVDIQDWKSIIQPLLPHVRFPNMKGQYFAANVVELKLLSAADCTYIMQCLLTGKESKALKYSTKKRTHPAQRQYATSSNAQYANSNKKK